MKHKLLFLLAAAGIASASMIASAALPVRPQTRTMQPIKLNAPNLKRRAGHAGAGQKTVDPEL